MKQNFRASTLKQTPQARWGCVAQHKKNGFECHLLKQFSFSTDDIECLPVGSRRCMFVVMFRPPDGSSDSFLNGLESVLNYANKSHLTWETMST